MILSTDPEYAVGLKEKLDRLIEAERDMRSEEESAWDAANELMTYMDVPPKLVAIMDALSGVNVNPTVAWDPKKAPLQKNGLPVYINLEAYADRYKEPTGMGLLERLNLRVELGPVSDRVWEAMVKVEQCQDEQKRLQEKIREVTAVLSRIQ